MEDGKSVCVPARSFSINRTKCRHAVALSLTNTPPCKHLRTSTWESFTAPKLTTVTGRGGLRSPRSTKWHDKGSFILPRANTITTAHTYTYTFACACTYTHTYICIYKHTHTYMYTYTHIPIHKHSTTEYGVRAHTCNIAYTLKGPDLESRTRSGKQKSQHTQRAYAQTLQTNKHNDKHEVTDLTHRVLIFDENTRKTL